MSIAAAGPAVASNPAGLRPSLARLRRLHPELSLVGGPVNLVRALGWGARGAWLERIADHLAHGDARPALVVTTEPLRVAAYSDELDAVVLLAGPQALVAELGLEPGRRLLAVNADHRARREGLADDLALGPGDTGRFGSFSPIIADFVSDDRDRIAALVAGLPEAEWVRCALMAEEHDRKHGRRARWCCPLACDRQAGPYAEVEDPCRDAWDRALPNGAPIARGDAPASAPAPVTKPGGPRGRGHIVSAGEYASCSECRTVLFSRPRTCPRCGCRLEDAARAPIVSAPARAVAAAGRGRDGGRPAGVPIGERILGATNILYSLPALLSLGSSQAAGGTAPPAGAVCCAALPSVLLGLLLLAGRGRSLALALLWIATALFGVGSLFLGATVSPATGAAALAFALFAVLPSFGLLLPPRFPGQVAVCAALQLLPLGVSLAAAAKPELVMRWAGLIEPQPPGVVRFEGCTFEVGPGWSRLTHSDARELILARGWISAHLVVLSREPASGRERASARQDTPGLACSVAGSLGLRDLEPVQPGVQPRGAGGSALLAGTSPTGEPTRALFCYVVGRGGRYGFYAAGRPQDFEAARGALEGMVSSLEVDDR